MDDDTSKTPEDDLEFKNWREFRDLFASLSPSLDTDETIENNFKWESRYWEWRERVSNPYYKNLFGSKEPDDEEAT